MEAVAIDRQAVSPIATFALHFNVAITSHVTHISSYRGEGIEQVTYSGDTPSQAITYTFHPNPHKSNEKEFTLHPTPIAIYRSSMGSEEVKHHHGCGSLQPTTKSL